MYLGFLTSSRESSRPIAKGSSLHTSSLSSSPSPSTLHSPASGRGTTKNQQASGAPASKPLTQDPNKHTFLRKFRTWFRLLGRCCCCLLASQACQRSAQQGSPIVAQRYTKSHTRPDLSQIPRKRYDGSELAALYRCGSSEPTRAILTKYRTATSEWVGAASAALWI